MELFDVYPLFDVTPVKGEGSYVTDHNGTQYLDLYGGHGVISVGHSHPYYVKKVQDQIEKLAFYSNAVQNPLQQELANKLAEASDCKEYQLFLCNSGAEANENALKLASFHTGKKRVIYFSNSFHGRTSGAVAVTDNEKIQAPLNKGHDSVKISYGDIQGLRKELQTNAVAAVILEVIQGVGGLQDAPEGFYREVDALCKEFGAVFIADEIQSGYGRTGNFFAFQKYQIQPDIITMAKGMGNGFPIGGVLIQKSIKPWHGMLGTTFGGNHLACAAAIAVLDIIKQEDLMSIVRERHSFLLEQAKLPGLKAIKGTGLMLGFEFEFEVSQLRKNLLYHHHIFTGASSNKNLLRILPPLNIPPSALEYFLGALKKEINHLQTSFQ